MDKILFEEMILKRVDEALRGRLRIFAAQIETAYREMTGQQYDEKRPEMLTPYLKLLSYAGYPIHDRPTERIKWPRDLYLRETDVQVRLFLYVLDQYTGRQKQ